MPKRPSKNAPRNYQYVVRHAHQETASRGSFVSADTAIGRAVFGYEHGACEAYVIRKTDGVRIYDGPAGLLLEHAEW